MLENVGVGVEEEELIEKSKIGNSGFYRQGSRIVVVSQSDSNGNSYNIDGNSNKP